MTVMECAQLVKANSIEGCKLKEVHVVYTRWYVAFHMFKTSRPSLSSMRSDLLYIAAIDRSLALISGGIS